MTRVAGSFLTWLVAAGCNSPGEGAPDRGDPPAVASPTAAVRFKGGERLRNEISRALQLAPAEVCNELGVLSCVDEVHTLALGGVDAYVAQVFRPSPTTGVTSPLAAERIAMAACAERSRRDFADQDEAVVWRRLPLSSEGTLVDVEDPRVAATVAELYRRALTREPSELELEEILGFYDDVHDAEPSGAAQAWATLSCFAVLTSDESLFY